MVDIQEVNLRTWQYKTVLILRDGATGGWERWDGGGGGGGHTSANWQIDIAQSARLDWLKITAEENTLLFTTFKYV